MSVTVQKSNFHHGGRLIMILALVILLGSIGLIIYRYSLPTDGWAVLSDEQFDSFVSSWRYYSNLVGAESGLQSHDLLLAVDGVSVLGQDPITPAPFGWRVGQAVTLSVQRGAEVLPIDAPVVNWTATAFIRYNILDVVRFSENLGPLLLLAVGWFTFLRRPNVPSARALLIFCTAVGATFISGMLPDGLSVQFNRLAWLLTGFFSYAIFGTVLAPALLTFALLFPNPKRAIVRRPWLALLPFVFGAALFVFLVLGGPGIVGWISSPLMFVLAISSLIHAWLTQRDAVSRAQLRWAISGFVLGLGLFMLNFPLAFNWVTQPTLANLMLVAQSLGTLAIGLGLSVAILRYRLWDIDIIIRKTLVYGALTAILALVFFGGVTLLQQVVGRITGTENSPIVIVISTLLIAALFSPLRRRIQDFIDRRFYRQKYNAEQALEVFASAARDETDIEHLSAELLAVVQETMQPERVNLWLRQ